MRVAVTGATGSLGGALIDLLKTEPIVTVTGLVAISRDEVKSGDLADRYAGWAPLKCVLGDVRDERRMVEVFRGCDAVIHAAALKRITHSVYSPEEIVKTNVQGTINVVRAATDAGVSRVVVVSSDKAVEPTNLYGMSKAVAEGYAVQANSYSYPRGTRVSCVRYGNVLGSRGSVVGVWRDQLRRSAPLTVTDKRMTRFVITLPQAARFVLRAMGSMSGGEVYVPVLPAAKVVDLAEAVAQSYLGAAGAKVARRVFTGLRPGGEKLHESLVSREEPARAWFVGDDGVVILPSHHSWRADFAVDGVKLSAPYTSDAPNRWLSVDDLVEMLREAP